MWNPFIAQMMEKLSPLYFHLSRQMEHDPEMVALEALVQRHQPSPITFFAAVNALLIRDQVHPLARYYPYLIPTPQSAHEAYPAFRHFCVTHRQELQATLPQMRLQTNEIHRCANWLPALSLVFGRGESKPVSLVELGCSAGLNLYPDRYSYRYRASSGYVALCGTSPILLECALEGDLMPPPMMEIPQIAERLGIDLFPLDVTNEQNVRRLLGAVGPEERTRYVILKSAIAQAQLHAPLPLLQGNAATLLPEVVEKIPAQMTACIVHSYALRQGDSSVLPRVEEILKQASKQRTIWRISLEMEQKEWDAPRLELFTYQGGEVHYECLATCEVHGDAMRWLIPAERLV